MQLLGRLVATGDVATPADAIVETEAIVALRRGDLRGLEPLVRLYQVRATRLAYGIVRDRSAAEDAAAEAFLKAADRIARYDPARPFAAWFFGIVTHEALRSIRRGRRMANAPGALESLETLCSPEPGPEELAEWNERGRLVHLAMAKLDPKDRAVLVLRYWFDLEEREVAEVLGSPLGTVKNRLHRARGRLQRLIACGPRAILEYLPAGGRRELL
jgi:RNA polymerase sigma-70 factor (ECF subfamily)